MKDLKLFKRANKFTKRFGKKTSIFTEQTCFWNKLLKKTIFFIERIYIY